jgi:hypothetical protein
MTFGQYARARQLLAEEFIGVKRRAVARAEDMRFQAGVSALRRDAR